MALQPCMKGIPIEKKKKKNPKSIFLCLRTVLKSGDNKNWEPYFEKYLVLGFNFMFSQGNETNKLQVWAFGWNYISDISHDNGNAGD